METKKGRDMFYHKQTYTLLDIDEACIARKSIYIYSVKDLMLHIKMIYSQYIFSQFMRLDLGEKIYSMKLIVGEEFYCQTENQIRIYSLNQVSNENKEQIKLPSPYSLRILM